MPSHPSDLSFIRSWIRAPCTSTLTSANNLARDPSTLGDYQQPRSLYEDTLARYRRVLGEDHPGTGGRAGTWRR